jgi:hypothetical protein
LPNVRFCIAAPFGDSEKNAPVVKNLSRRGRRAAEVGDGAPEGIFGGGVTAIGKNTVQLAARLAQPSRCSVQPGLSQRKKKAASAIR